jgi:D-alanyl-D-alanine carboxypeptidase (penicillin-binding protein 5/6)
MIGLMKICKITGIIALLAAIALLSKFNYIDPEAYEEGKSDSPDTGAYSLEDEVKKENQSANSNQKEDSNENDNLHIPESNTKEQSNEEIKLNAISAVLMDAANGRLLYKKNAFKELPMASTTKIMTCIIALENAELSDIVTVSSYAARMPDVQLNIRTGEQYYLKDLLYSLMLASHNDVAVAIAEHVGGSVEGFATMMNDKARMLGCNNTNFVTPNGLDAAGHYTTARDLAVIAAYAIQNKKFLEITNTSSYKFCELINRRSFTVSNKNKFLYMMEGAIGVKTGFTGSAGYCFVGAVKRTDRTLISVVLGCGWPPNKSLKWKDTVKLMNYGIDNYKLRQIFEYTDLAPVPVEKGVKKYVNLSIDGDLKLLMRDDETVSVKYEVSDILKAPVQANAIAGYANYYIDRELYARLPIYTAEEVLKLNLPFCIKKVTDYLLMDF